MSSYIGCQISLISKSDIRYVGILYQIDSESATVALQDVRSYGTEGRKASANPPEEEVPGTEQIYDYIVFRGNDVAHLNIIKQPDELSRPQMPDDPAIIGSNRPPQPQQQQPPQQWQQQQPPLNQYPPYGYPPQQNSQFAPPSGPHGFPGPQGPPFGGMPPYNGPPGGGWYPGPPGQNFPGVPPTNQMRDQQPFPSHPGQPQPSGPSPLHSMQEGQSKDAFAKPPMAEQGMPENRPVQQSDRAPQLRSQEQRPTELSATPTKPNVAANATKRSDGNGQGASNPDALPKGSRSNRDASVAVPLASKQESKAPVANTFASIAAQNNKTASSTARSSAPSGPKPSQAQEDRTRNGQDVTSRAAAAVAAAMAKLGPAPGKPQGPQAVDTSSLNAQVDNLTRRFNDTRVSNDNRGGRGGHTHHQHHHRGRGGAPRRGPGGPRNAPLEIPQNDFDFAEANAKLNKEDVLKEANAAVAAVASPAATPGAEGNSTPSEAPDNGDAAVQNVPTPTTHLAPIPIPTASTYDKKSSFFDNISSDLKDRVEEQQQGGEYGGNSEGHGQRRNNANNRFLQRKQNMETFGQGSVDGGYGRGGHRGRGRGGHRGRGYRDYRGGRTQQGQTQA